MLSSILLFYAHAVLQPNVSPDVIKDYIIVQSLNIGLDPQIPLGVANAESQFNPKAVGDHGESFGMYQIHLPAHRDISVSQAEDIIFSTNWSLVEMKQNGCKIWSTCSQVMKQIQSPMIFTDTQTTSDGS